MAVSVFANTKERKMNEEVKQEGVKNSQVVEKQPENVKPSENVNNVESQQSEEHKNTDTGVEKNWIQARRVMKSQQSEIETLKQQVNKMNTVPEKDEFADIDKDDYVTFAQAQRLAEKKAIKEAGRIASKIVDEKMRLINGKDQEKETRAKYQDYDYVIDNFAIPMIENNPALAESLKVMPDFAETAYKLAKASKEYENDMQTRQKKETSKAADKVIDNTHKPVSINAASSSSLSSSVSQFASMSTEEVWKLSKEYARRA